MKVPVTLALKELRHDWQAAACFLAALVGVLAPLLIILALKNGVIATLLGRLVDDPSNRELIAVGARSHDAAFFQTFEARDDVAFVLPATRRINTVANAVRHQEARRLERKVTLIPSAAGDPLIPDAQVAPGRVVLSEALAAELEAGPGDVLELRIERRIDGLPETALRDLAVAGLARAELYGRKAMFLSLPDLVAVERFRDDAAISIADWTASRPAPETYASFRLYAATLVDVDGLEAELSSMGVESRPRAENVALLISFRRGLDLLFLVIAAIAATGFWAAMAANLRGAVERQRTSLSLLALLGLPEGGRRLIPTVQSVVLVMGGVALTLLLVLPTLVLINRVFVPDGLDSIARLGPLDIFGTVLLGLVTAISASIWAVFAIKEITPDEVLRAT